MPNNYKKLVQNNFEKLVQNKVLKLSNLNLNELEKEAAQERISWVHQRGIKKFGLKKSKVREAFELFFFDFLGLEEEDVPVSKETDKEIVFASQNRCDTLAACERIGFDTREVCRAVYEKSTQAFLSQIDPEIRFYRSYEKIRPYHTHCEERLVQLDFEKFMEMAIEEATISKDEGNHGFGAVVVMNGEILSTGHDTTNTEKDPSLHAEVNVLRKAVKAFGDSNLCGSILFSTCEPCPMCSSLAVWSNVTSIVYGASIEDTIKSGRSRIRVSAKEISQKSPILLEVIGDILKEECLKLYS